MKIERFAEYPICQMRAEISAALAAVQEKYGVVFDLGTIRYSDNEFSGKLRCVLKPSAANGETVSDEKAKYLAQCRRHGLSEEHYMKPFMNGATQYFLCGFTPTAKKYKVNAKNSKGEVIRFTAQYVKQKLGLVPQFGPVKGAQLH